MQPSDQRQLMLPGQSDAYLQDRANTMQSIESTIVELGGIFQQLAHMIKEQVIYTYNSNSWFFAAEKYLLPFAHFQ